MNRSALPFSFFVLLSFCLAMPAQADWSWNPFGGSKEKTASKSSASDWWPDWKMPKMPSMGWSRKPKPSSYSRSKATTWQKMSKTSKQWWAKTADILDPYPDPKPPVDESVSSTKKKKASFTSWFKKEEPKEYGSVSEWLKQDMP
jgi:hypothetical protein